MGTQEANRGKGEQVQGGEKELLESGSEGCKQARSRSRNSRKEKKKRGFIPPMVI